MLNRRESLQVLSAMGLAVVPTCGERPAHRRPSWPLKLTSDLAEQRGSIMAVLDRAYARVGRFASEAGLEVPFARISIAQVSIFGTKDDFDRAHRAARQADPESHVPLHHVAMLRHGELYACAETPARSADPRISSHDEYVKVLSHEIAHALHIAAAAGESRTGPRWFREGFASVTAGQYASAESLSRDDWYLVTSGARDDDYAMNAAAVRMLARRYSFASLIARAHRTDFSVWAAGAAPQ